MLINRPLPTHYQCLPPPLTPSVKNMNVEGEYFKKILNLNAEIGGCSENELDLPLCCPSFSWLRGSLSHNTSSEKRETCAGGGLAGNIF